MTRTDCLQLIWDLHRQIQLFRAAGMWWSAQHLEEHLGKVVREYEGKKAA